MCSRVLPPTPAEIVNQNLLPPLLELVEALLEVTGTVIRDAYPAVLDIHFPAREQTGASAFSTAIFNQAWALADTVRSLRHHFEDLETPSAPPLSSTEFPF